MINGINIPERVNYSKVDKESLLKGEYLVVKDQTAKTIIYKNPRSDLDFLLEQLRAQKQFKEKEGKTLVKIKENSKNIIS